MESNKAIWIELEEGTIQFPFQALQFVGEECGISIGLGDEGWTWHNLLGVYQQKLIPLESQGK